MHLVTAMLTEPAFADLYATNIDRARRVCALFGVRRGDVDDVAHRVFTKIWVKRDAWCEPRNVAAYIAECARNEALMYHRALKTQKRALTIAAQSELECMA